MREQPAQPLTAWVQTQVALLDPPADWQPSVAIARGRFEGRLRRSRKRRYWLIAAATIAIVCAIIPAIPATRAFAQPAEGRGWYRLDSAWYWLTFWWNGPGVAFKDSGSLPDAVKALHAQALLGLAAAEAVLEAAEASRRTGFEPRFPRALPNPLVSVLPPMSFDWDVRAADIEASLQKAGARDFEVPASWDGARIGLRLGPTVIANWAGGGGPEWTGIRLAQGPLPVVVAPAGFNLAEFAIANLRAGRVGREKASQFVRVPTLAAALLIGKGTPNELPWAVLREVSLRNGAATLIEEAEVGYDTPLVVRLSLLWNVADRMYALSGIPAVPIDLMGADLARAWTNLAAIANTIE